ncbi:hypothetical protein FHT70_005279 [Rhizobium sp. BK049]|nr:hypothetical protein [Rhizobium sp. BK049]MBB3355318.1 hypothetical protein [Rhizobium sp. BK049]
MAGHFAAEGLQFFLDADGDWYQIDPPRRVYLPNPINWRPSYVRMTPERRNLIKKRLA